MATNPAKFAACGDDCPVEQVSWQDAKRFIEKVNQYEKTEAYRLPSEAEWEYACRAGTTTEYSFGDDSRKLGEYGWYKDNSNRMTQRVATKGPNPWGLYDMHGNVWEWVEDDWHDSYDSAPNDGQAWIENPRASNRVIRGGSWSGYNHYCESAMRNIIKPDYPVYDVGFRLAKSISTTP